MLLAGQHLPDSMLFGVSVTSIMQRQHLCGELQCLYNQGIGPDSQAGTGACIDKFTSCMDGDNSSFHQVGGCIHAEAMVVKLSSKQLHTATAPATNCNCKRPTAVLKIKIWCEETPSNKECSVAIATKVALHGTVLSSC